MALPFNPQILSTRAVIRLAGENTLGFLHNLLTCEIETLPAGTWAYGALLSPQGKIQHDVFVLHDGATTFIDCAASQAEALLQKLKLYRLRAKIQIEREDALAIAVATGEGHSAPDPRLANMGRRAIVAASTLPGGDGYDAARIGAGLADSDADIGVNGVFPHEANLDQLRGVSFTKGCYVGQEVVSRMQHRGTARTRILPVVAAAQLPPRGTAIRSGEAVLGSMLSSTGQQGLALLRLDRLAEAVAPLLTGDVSLRVQKPDWMTIDIAIPEFAR